MFMGQEDSRKIITKEEILKLANDLIKKDYEYMAGKKVGIAILWIPKILFFCRICCGITLFSLLVTLMSIHNTPSPTIFLNYQDGTLLCSQNPVDPKTGAKYAREEAKYESLCNNLNNVTKGDE